MVMVFGDDLHRRRTSAATYAIASACVAVAETKPIGTNANSRSISVIETGQMFSITTGRPKREAQPRHQHSGRVRAQRQGKAPQSSLGA